MRHPYDICIIGAGPAGSTLAARLAHLGHRVCMVERSSFPRRHLGESLSPGVLPLLEAIGVREAIEAAGFARVHRISISWDQGPREREDPEGKGLLVDRAIFDQMLLDNAIGLGVELLQPATLLKVYRSNGAWVLLVKHGGRRFELHASFLADAAGRAGAIPKCRRPTGCRTVALHAYWRGRHFPTQPRVEAGTDAWYWGVPLPDGTYNTLVFADPERLRTQQPVSLEKRFRDLLDSSGLMAGCREAKRVSAILAADATPYIEEECVTESSIKVGDAALALDPLSSSGVQKAIQTALSGAIVVNTLLRRPDSSEAALAFYRDRLSEASDRHRRWAANHYETVAREKNTRFWKDRARAVEARPKPVPRGLQYEFMVDQPVRLSSEVHIASIPVLDEQFVSTKSAVRHPRLDGPVAYVDGHELAGLLDLVRPGMTLREIMRSWSSDVSPETGRRICRWMVGMGVLVGQPGSPRS